jgi:hypothetical protein
MGQGEGDRVKSLHPIGDLLTLPLLPIHLILPWVGAHGALPSPQGRENKIKASTAEFRFNNTDGCSFIVCGNTLQGMDMREVVQRNVAQVDQNIEGMPISHFGSLTKSTRLGLIVRQGWDGLHAGDGIVRLFRNP